MVKAPVTQSVEELIEPSLLAKGLELVDVDFKKEGKTWVLRIFIDKSVVEVFANGKQCVAQRVYPGLKDSDGISLRAQGSEAELIAFDAWQMKSIYND